MEESEKQMLTAKANESRLKQGLCISEQRVQALDGEHSRIKDIVDKQYRQQISQLEIRMQQLKDEREAELCQVHTRYFMRLFCEEVSYYLNQIKRGAGEKGAMHRAAEIARSRAHQKMQTSGIAFRTVALARIYIINNYFRIK
jgi:hypothetical protein